MHLVHIAGYSFDLQRRMTDAQLILQRGNQRAMARERLSVDINVLEAQLAHAKKGDVQKSLRPHYIRRRAS